MKRLLGGLALVGLMAVGAEAAGLYTNGVPQAGGNQYPSTVPLTGNELLPADTQLPGGLNPASEAISVGQLGVGVGTNNPRNYLANGAMAVAQKGLGAVVGGTTTVGALAFAADRWFVDTNVVGGAGKAQVVATGPAGFGQSLSLWRNSGALTQPVCMLQEIENSRSVQMQGRYVVLSAQVQALAGLTSVGGQVNAFVVTGTGVDEGLATPSATPAVTPAWTGLASQAAGTWATTSSWAKYWTTPVLVPTGANEVGVEICFTPTGSASGVTDGIAVTSVQLETVNWNGVGNGPGPSPFEFRAPQADLADAQRFFYQLNEPANNAATVIAGMAESGTVQALTLELPVTMRGTTPILGITTVGTFKEMIGTVPTTWVTPSAGVCSTMACQILTGNTTTALSGIVVTGGGGTGIVFVRSDVVM